MSEYTLKIPQFMQNEFIQKSLNNSTITINSLNSPRNKRYGIDHKLTFFTRRAKPKYTIPKEISLKDILKHNITQSEKNSTSTFKLYEKPQNFSSNFNIRNNSPINNSNSNDENVLITSLFTLPSINKNDSKTISSSQFFSNNKENGKNFKIHKKIKDFPNISRNNDPLVNYAISQTEKNAGKEMSKSIDKINTKRKEELKLENYMREKFYEDIEKKMTYKLRNRNFCHDHFVKDRLIQMNQVGLFWGGVFEYCNPLLCVKKFKCVKENLFKQRLLKAKLNNTIIDDDELEYYNLKKKKIQRPRLYTNNLISEIRHPEKNKSVNK